MSQYYMRVLSGYIDDIAICRTMSIQSAVKKFDKALKGSII